MTELQTRVLNLLKEIDELCKENDISYYLIGGTLIGAVRHHGFIPWDDDADIIMTRDNWEKFYSSFKASSYIKNRKINALDDNVNTPLHVNKYCETTSANISRFHLVNPEEIGILVDVLVMDPIPEDDNVKNAYIKTIATQNELINLHYPYSFRNGLDTCLNITGKK